MNCWATWTTKNCSHQKPGRSLRIFKSEVREMQNDDGTPEPAPKQSAPAELPVADTTTTPITPPAPAPSQHNDPKSA